MRAPELTPLTWADLLGDYGCRHGRGGAAADAEERRGTEERVLRSRRLLRQQRRVDAAYEREEREPSSDCRHCGSSQWEVCVWSEIGPRGSYTYVTPR